MFVKYCFEMLYNLFNYIVLIEVLSSHTYVPVSILQIVYHKQLKTRSFSSIGLHSPFVKIATNLKHRKNF